MTTEIDNSQLEQTEAEQSQVTPPVDRYDNQFRYRPVPVLAPVALFFGICSLFSFFTPTALVLALFGTVLGSLATKRIVRSGGEFGGGTLAKAGLGLSAFCLVAGSSFNVWAYHAEVPEGYERLSFNWLSKQEPRILAGRIIAHPEALKYEGKKVFIKGYMYPNLQTTDIKDFLMVRSTKCCFGGQPKPKDMIEVRLKGNVFATYSDMRLISVAGILHVQKERASMSGEDPIYSLEGHYFK